MSLFDFFKGDFLTPSVNPLPHFGNAYILANIAQLSYKSSVNADHTTESYKSAVRETLESWGISYDDAKRTIFINSKEIPNKDGSYTAGTQGLIIFHGNTAIISFRGSEKKANDWFNNANIRPEYFQYGEGKAHKGFVSAFDAIIGDSEDATKNRTDLIEDLKKCEHLWLTGHSLGGAIAIIGANFLLSEGIDKNKIAGIYTFGAPRVGNAEYRDYVNKTLTSKYWRFMHDHDAVPDLPPPRFMGYSRDGCMIRIKKQGNQTKYKVLRTLDSQGKRHFHGSYNGYKSSDHSMDEYILRLLDLAKTKQNLQLPNIDFKKLVDESINGRNPYEWGIHKHIIAFFYKKLNQQKQGTIDLSLDELIEEFDIDPTILDSFFEDEEDD